MAVRPNDPEALYLYQLIGAPLLAVVQAEAQAAQVSADFIKHIGFEARAEPPPPAPGSPADDTPKPPRSLQEGGEFGELRMARFNIDRLGQDGRPQPHVAQIPVLSMFPIPLMQVKHADFEFDIRILTRVPLDDTSKSLAAQISQLRADTAPLDPKDVDPNRPDMTDRGRPLTDFLTNDRVELKGFLASTRGGADGRPSMEASIKVKVRMEQSDLPAGLIRLMSMMGESAGVAPRALVEQNKAADGAVPPLVGGTTTP